jgi:DNA-binding response OmpR family regulator
MLAWKPSSDIKTQTILVISKDVEMLNVWTTFFKEKNYQAIHESEAKDGLQTSHLLTPALIILDLDLPQNQSLEFCRQLRSTTNGSIILLSKQNNETEISNYYQAGVDEFIAKPVNPMAVLIKAITRLARQEWILPRKEVIQINA